MPSKAARSRRSSEGSVSSYSTKAGTRWRYQIRAPKNPDNPDGPKTLKGKAGYADENTATDAMLKALTARNAGVPTTSGHAPTVAAYAKQWAAALNRDDLAGATISSYERHVRVHITPKLGSVRLDKLTPQRIAAFYTELRANGSHREGHEGAPLSSNTVNKIRVTLTAILTAAVDDGWILTNPAQTKTARKSAPRPKRIRAERPEVVTWDGGMLRGFLQWSSKQDDELFPLWHLIAMTGVRRSEALALKWQDLDARNARLSIRRAVDTSTRNATKSTKTDRPRVISISGETVKMLRELKALRGSITLDLARRDSYIFGLPDGRLRRPDSVSALWSKRVTEFRADRTDVPALTLHGLRHSHATILLAAGEHPKVVQERLGHSTIATTMDLYSHVTETMQRGTVERFARMLEG